MSEEEKKEEIKYNAPLFSVDEYAQLQNNINFHLEEYTNEILKTLSKDKEVVILKKVINKQQKEIDKLKSKKYIINAETNEIKEMPISGNYISKDKIREKIKEYEEHCVTHYDEHAVNVLLELLEENE